MSAPRWASEASEPMAQVAIVGAGVAGLAAAGELARAGHEVTLFERSGEVGGRVCTGRVAGFAIDHGAQVVKAPTDAVRALVAVAGAHDLAAPVWTFDAAGRVSPGDPALNAEPAWVWPGGNVALAQHMARGLRVHLGAAVAVLRRAGPGYELIDAGGAVAGPYRAVLLAAPAPEAAAIVAASALDPASRDELAAALAAARYRPCVSVALAYARRPAPPWYALVNADRRHPIAWLACEHAKPGRAPAGHALMLAQMGPAWSAARWDELPDGAYGQGAPLPAPLGEVHALVAALAGEELGAPLWADVRRWRYALCDAPCGAAAIEGRAGIFVAGDLEAGQGRAHRAVESGWAAARRIAAWLA